MKLEIWIDGSLEIMHVFFFLPVSKNWLIWEKIALKFGKYNTKTGPRDNAQSTEYISMKHKFG
jgi:hypothetical protein